jgi:DNA-binding XRE family transcriptional regulator
MKKVKSAIETLFGPSAIRKFQIPVLLPRDPAVLAQAAQNVLGALGTHKLPAPQVEGVGKVDASVWVELLGGPLGRLKTARAKVNLEDKQLAAAIDLRDRAYAAASEAMVEGLQLARALARIADKDALFDGLRATPATTASEAADDPPADPAKPAPPAP